MAAITGKDAKVEITSNGQTLGIIDKIERFTEDEVVDLIETLPLGQQGRVLDQEFRGHRGTMEIPVYSDDLDVLRDAIAAARALRVPTVINIPVKYTYDNGQTKQWLYRDCKLTFGKEVRRAEKVVMRIQWETGNERIAL